MTPTTPLLLRRHAARFVALVLALALGGLTLAAAGSAKANSRSRSDHRRGQVQPRSGGWLTTWAASPMQASPGTPLSAGGFDDQTLREIVYPSAGGSQVRVRLSNVFGTQPLVVGAASIGVQLAGANVVPGTLRGLTFGGKATVTIPAGQEVLSDPARYHVAAEENLAISIYLPAPPPPTPTPPPLLPHPPPPLTPPPPGLRREPFDAPEIEHSRHFKRCLSRCCRASTSALALQQETGFGRPRPGRERPSDTEPRRTSLAAPQRRDTMELKPDDLMP